MTTSPQENATAGAVDGPLWTPSAEVIAQSNVTAFSRQAERDWGVSLPDWWALLDWSVAHSEDFFKSLWSFTGVIAETQGEHVLADGDKKPGARWFPDARLNFAENLLRRRDDAPAIIFQGEDRVRREMSYRELYDLVSRTAQALAADGVGPGDRVVGFMPNMPETIIAMLAAASLGAVWSSCSPDFGVKGVMDRFGQIEPAVLFTADGYYYNGKQHDSLARVREITAQLDSLKRIVVVPYTSDAPPLDGLANATTLTGYIADYAAQDIPFARLPFNHPLFIMYSSGTTGAPKCIVHGAGGCLLQLMKEHQLHVDLRRGDRVFYFTTCGWMMWNWLATALATEVTIVLYDGSPFYPDANMVFDLVDREKVSFLGKSATFLVAVNIAGLTPMQTHDLSSVRLSLYPG